MLDSELLEGRNYALFISAAPRTDPGSQKGCWINEVEIEGIQLDNLQDLIQLQYSVMQFKYVPIDALTCKHTEQKDKHHHAIVHSPSVRVRPLLGK